MRTFDFAVQLSAEHLVECDQGDCGAFGGWPHQAFEWVKKNGGIMSSADMPYCAGTGYGAPGACMPCMCVLTVCLVQKYM